ncbi:MAG: hypothetical protein HYY01_10245 [Chloroflexi bacterium]|nr:hypothetical protein [Chloroflexota bacterium]
MQSRYPPHTEEIEKLADFFDQMDTTELTGVGEVVEVPERDLVTVSLRIPRHDLEVLKRIAAQEGLASSTYMRWVLRRFVRSLAARRR